MRSDELFDEHRGVQNRWDRRQRAEAMRYDALFDEHCGVQTVGIAVGKYCGAQTDRMAVDDRKR